MCAENLTIGSHSTGWDFFVSYTHADQSWAEWISWQLESAGYRVLLQAWDMVPGSNWSASMQEGVQFSQRTIAVLSQAYLASVYGASEWQAAWQGDPLGTERKLIPVRVEDCPRSGLLGGVVSIDLFDLTAAAARELLLKKIEEVKLGRAKPAVEPSYPGTQAPRAPRPSEPPEFPGHRSDPVNDHPSFGVLRIRASRRRAQIFVNATRPRVLIDGEEHIITWNQHEFRVSVGRHEILIYFPYPGFDRCGIASSWVEVMPNETIEVGYRAPAVVSRPGNLQITYPASRGE